MRKFPIVPLLAMLVIGAPVWAANLPATVGRDVMVVSPERHATAAGIEILRAGGNAVDATVAVHFVLAVTFPLAGNLGGGGFLLYRTPEGKHRGLDFREMAPRGLTPESFLDEDGRPIPGLSTDHGLAVAVPGSVAGLARAHKKWGRLDWPRLLEPAIRLADEGFEVYPFLSWAFERAGDRLRRDPATRAIFTHDGALLDTGDRLVQKELAITLRSVAEGGARAFYRGPIASAIAASVEAAGGVLDERDLAAYRPVFRDPISATYRGYRVVSFPPPSSGGIVLLQILGMLESTDLAASGPGSSQTAHRMAEAERRAYADRSRWLGDPEFADVPATELLDPAYLARRAASIDDDRATPSAQVRPGEPQESGGGQTLHFSVADPGGGAVSITTTLNSLFGACIVADGTGILLNNQVDDFAIAPGMPNQYGLLGGDANAVAPGKRPLSSMTPTIVEFPEPGPRPALVLGSPGGSVIITSVLQVLVNVIDHRMPLQEAVNAPRFHHQWQPDRLRHETRAFSADVIRNLRSRGHALQESPVPLGLGNVNAIGTDVSGAWLGAADPRRQGAAEGY